MKYRSKPVVVDLVVFYPDRLDDLCYQYPRIRLTRDRDGAWTLFNELHQSPIHIQPGDYINVTTPNDYYPITPDIVAQKYEPDPTEVQRS